MWRPLWESLVIGTHPGPSEEYVEDFLMPQTLHGPSASTSWGLLLESDSQFLLQNTSIFFLYGANRGSFHCDWNTSRYIQNHRCGMKRHETNMEGACCTAPELKDEGKQLLAEPSFRLLWMPLCRHQRLALLCAELQKCFLTDYTLDIRSVLDKDSNPMWSRKPCPAFAQCCPPHLTLFSHLFRILSKDTMPRWSQHSYFLFAPEVAQFSILSTEEHFSFVSRIGYDFPGHLGLWNVFWSFQ